MATYYVRSAGGNSNTAATWSTTSSAGSAAGSPPTAADDVILDSGSGNLTINAAMVCRSMDCNGFTGTVTHNASVTLTIGDATAGTGNIALRLSSGMTYTKAATSSAISFVSTSATQQTITTNGKTVGNITFNATSNGSWQFADAITGITSSVLNLTKGSLDTNSVAISFGSFTSTNANVRSLTLGTSNLTFSATGAAWNTLTNTNLTYSGASASITLTGTNAGFYSGHTVNAVTWTGSGTNLVQGTTFTNLTVTGTAVKTDAFKFYSAVTVTGTLTLNGNSATNRLWVTTDTGVRTITAAAVSASNIDITDITGAGAASWNLASITGNSGDAGGNSGITFTTAATQTATGTASFTWSTHGWTSRVPLPQDNVVINNAFVATRVITVDMPRIGKNITCNCTGSPTFTLAGNCESYGNIDLTGIGATSGGLTWTAHGTGSQTITNAGVTWNNSLEIDGSGGTYTLQDAFTSNNDLISTNGTFVANNYNVTLAHYSCGTGTKTLTMGSGTWTLTSTGTVWSTTSGITLTPGTSTIVISNTSATGKTFSGASRTYNNLTCSGDSITITGSNTFNNLAVNTAGRTTGLKLTSGATQTVSSLSTNGSAGNLAKLVSSSSGSAATISKASGTVSLDYMSIQDSTATGGASFFAGSNSTNVSGNTGWTFTGPTSVGSATADSTAVGVGLATFYSVGSAVADSTAVGVGQSTFRAVGSAVADSTAVGVGQSTFRAAGSAVADSIAVGVGQSTFRAVGSATADSTAVGVGQSLAAGTGTSDGMSTAQAVGSSIASTVGECIGDSTAEAVGASICAAVGAADGVSTCDGYSESITDSAGAADGVSTAEAVGASIASTVGECIGDSTAEAVGASIYSADGQADGESTAEAVGASIFEAVGAADGDSTAEAVGDYSIDGSAGEANGDSTAAAVGAAIFAAVGAADGDSTADGHSAIPGIIQTSCACNSYQDTGSGGIKFGGTATRVSNALTGGIVFGGTCVIRADEVWRNFSNVWPLSEIGLGVEGEYVDIVQGNDGTGGAENEDSVPSATDGVFCQTAQAFDGDDFIELNHDKLNTTQAITVSAWVKIESFGKSRTIYSRGYDSESTSWILQLGHTYANQITASVQTVDDLGNKTVTTVQGTEFLNQNVNYHFGLVYVPGDSIKVYVNGILAGTRAVTDLATVPNDSGNYIGRWNLKANPTGNIQEVRVSGVARSAAWLKAEKDNFCGNFYEIGEEKNAILS